MPPSSASERALLDWVADATQRTRDPYSMSTTTVATFSA